MQMKADDLSREVYCVLGVPLDAVEMPAVLRAIKAAAADRTPLLISTPNLNFLSISQRNSEFCESLLLSDLCTIDGMPVVWLARLMGLPISKRVAGSDIFEALRSENGDGRPLKVFLFGALPGVAATACAKINSEGHGLVCVGSLFPGFGSIEELSQNQLIDQINQSNADVLVTSLGAEKGQLWFLRNRSRLSVPVMSHLGAAIGFQAGVIRRAPAFVRKFGLEWVWRIKEEPKLWTRYWHDGLVLLRLLVLRVLPIVVEMHRVKARNIDKRFTITQLETHQRVAIQIAGFATAQNVPQAIACFRAALEKKKKIAIDFSKLEGADARFLGLLIMLRKQLRSRGEVWQLTGIYPKLRRQFRLNGLGFLFEGESDDGMGAH